MADFRAGAAGATLRVLEDNAEQAFTGLAVSGCMPIRNGRVWHWAFELPAVVISMLCLVISVLALPLTLLGVLPRPLFLPVLLTGFGVTLVLRKVKSWLLRLFLASRPGYLPARFDRLPTKPVGIENGKTHATTKLVIEDEGVCLLDAGQQRVLIDGCEYRYILYAKEVKSVEPVSGYALSGARVQCQMAGEEIEFVITTTGQGPLASLAHAFVPGEGAKGLSSLLNQTWFGLNGPVYRQSPVPPVLEPR